LHILKFTFLVIRINSFIFIGKVVNSVHYTNCGRYVVYPLGTFVVVKNLKTDKESFLDGHSHDVTVVKVSKDGTKVGSGQSSFPGVKVMNPYYILYNITS
jgi:hypothetical protein